MFARTIPFVIIAAAVALVLMIDTPAASSERKERLYMCSVARLVHDLEWANDAYRESGYPEYAHAHIEDLADRLVALQAPLTDRRDIVVVASRVPWIAETYVRGEGEDWELYNYVEWPYWRISCSVEWPECAAPTLHFMPPPEDCDPELADWLQRARRAGCDEASEFGRLTRRCTTDAH